MHRTNIDLDERVLDEARRLTGLKTKKELVNFALHELVRRLRQRELLELEGRVDWRGDLAELRNSRA